MFSHIPILKMAAFNGFFSELAKLAVPTSLIGSWINAAAHQGTEGAKSLLSNVVPAAKKVLSRGAPVREALTSAAKELPRGGSTVDKLRRAAGSWRAHSTGLIHKLNTQALPSIKKAPMVSARSV